MAYSADSFVADEQPTTAKWNKLWNNDAAFNDGSGIADGAIINRHITDGDLSASKLDADAIGPGYSEIGRTTLGSAGDTISVSSIPAKKYLRLEILLKNSGSISADMTFNNDSGSNYSHDIWINNSVQAGGSSQSASPVSPDNDELKFAVIDIVNVEDEEKLYSCWQQESGGAGASNRPDSRRMDGKWANTSAQISRIDLNNSGAGSYGTGSEILVLGKD